MEPNSPLAPQNVGPPKWLDKLLMRLVAPHLREEVMGDIHERYYLRVQRLGERKARHTYWREVLAYTRPSVIKRQPNSYPKPTNTDMLRNYLKIAFRNLTRNKVSSFINISGLAVGMAVAILNALWIWDEISFDKYHQNYDRIAQVMSRTDYKGELGINKTLQYPLATELKANHSANFKHIVVASWVQEYILSAGDKKVSKTGQFIEAEAPEMLTLKMRYGSWAALKDPNSILLSSSTAKALFGDADPINKLVKINNKTDVKVTGVYEDLPQNTDFHPIQFFSPWDLWMSQNTWVKERAIHDWRNHFLRIYAEIKPTTDFATVTANIRDAELKNVTNFKEEADLNPQVFLQPMSQWHLYSTFKKGILDPEPARMVWLVGIIGAFVLLLACINFMNLSTARSEKRAREVGIRKAVGSVRGQLINQFFSESFLVVILAFVTAIVLFIVLLPWFNDLAAKQMTIPWNNGWFWLASLSFIGLTGLLAGSYPAFYLSSFQPVKVLKGTFRIGKFIAVPRKMLVVVQFTVSVTLIISTISVYRQIQFAKNRPVGYTREGLIMMEMKSDDFNGKYDVLRNELQHTGVVAEMSESMGKVTTLWSNNGGFDWKGKDPKLEDNFGTLAVTHEHGKTVGWQFVDGRDFSRDFASDSSGMVINETAAKYMGLKHPVGETVRWKWWLEGGVRDYKILGVIKDIVMASPYKPVEPTIFFIKGFNGGVNYINIKLNPQVSASEALPKIEAVFKQIIPSAPFDYQFVNQDYALKFAAEERIGKLAGFFAILAIFISCLGLFGLASFMAEQRTKEIGVRKVLGASVLNLWGLLSKDFVVLVIIAFGVATPIAYYFLSNWLEKYTYRAELSWWIFAVSGAGALLVTLLTISFQSVKAALVNPVHSLRSE